jgi:hypothetical protein
MHGTSWVLQTLIDIMEDEPLLLTPKTTVLNLFITGCGVPIIAPHNNVVRLRHALVVGSCCFPFAPSLNFCWIFLLRFSCSLPLTLMDHHFINKHSFFIRNKLTLALRYTQNVTTATYERESKDTMGISICKEVTEGGTRIRLYEGDFSRRIKSEASV